MEEQELKNFLRGEGEELTEIASPTIDITERLLQDIAAGIEEEGLDHLINNLGTIANTFKTENDFSCSTEVITEGVTVIHTALQRIYNGITALQGNVKGSLVNIDRLTKLKYRKYMAVSFFLINKSFVEIERAVTADSHNISIQHQVVGQKGKRTKKQQAASSDDSKYQFWNFWRPKIISKILQLVAHPMEEIWEGGNLEGYNFMRCITLALCNTIKNKAKRLRTIDPETEEIFDILGCLAAMHQEEKGILSRLIPLLKGSEETGSVIADGVDRMIKRAPENQRENMVMRALTEALDTYMTRMEKETSAEKGFHAFLTGLATHQPKGYMQSLAVVVQFLEADSPTVRNAVVIVAHQLMNWVWAEMKVEENEPPNEEEERDERPNINNWLNLRKKLLDEILLLHSQDVAAVVRTKTLQMLADIIKNKAVVPAESVKIMRTVRQRLLDKNNYPRKHATSLVIDIVKGYPHIVRPAEEYLRKRKEKLDVIVSTILNDHPNKVGKALYFIIKEFHLYKKMEGYIISSEVKEKVADEESALTTLEEYLKEKSYWEACETLFVCTKKWTTKWEQLMSALRRHDDDQEEHLYLRFFKLTHADLFPESVDDLELEEVNYLVPKRIHDCRDFLNYIQCSFRMKEELDKCQPSLRKLLELGTTSDKKEAVMFFAAICEAGYKPPHAVTVSIINALAQLTDEELNDFADPFKSIFIGRDNYGPHGVVKRLLELVEQLSENLVESLSSIIGQLYSSGSLNAESIKILWDAFSLSTGGWNASASCSAAHLLGIIGQIERKIITSNLNQLIEVGLGERAINDYELAKVTLQALLLGCRTELDAADKENTNGKGKSKANKPTRKNGSEEIKFPPTHDLFVKIVDLIEYGLKTEGNEKLDIMYPRVVELSTQIIYRMCTEPIDVIKRFLPNIHGMVFAVEAAETDEIDPFKLSERILFRYMSFGKALLGAHITYYEQIVAKEIKERKTIKEKANKKNKTANRQRVSRMSNGNNVTNSTTNGSMMNQSNQEAAAEMDLVMGHIGFDAEQDRIKSYVAGLLDQGFFRQFRVHVFFLCQDFTKFKSINLKVACVQALAKLMLVCEKSVNHSLDTFIKLWQGEDGVDEEPFAVKLEILRASVRLTVKFPNQMERMNECLTSGLSSTDANVRKACMDYICYLSLSDLLKVRQQLPDTAACLCDESFELREMAKDFINQIAEKDNVLQNCIPDITARLSEREDIPQTNFQSIMKTLLQKIKKEKQLGGLVEKFVGRFKGIVSVRSCQDTIFCLNQIPQNEKTLKIMKDSINLYADKLGDPIVWDLFMELASTFKKLNKPEIKAKIEEWEKELEDNHEKCVSLDNADKAAKRKHEKQRVVDSSSDEEEEQEEGNENNENEEEADENDGGSNEEQDEDEQNQEDENQEDEEMEDSNEEDADEVESMDEAEL